MIDELAGGEHRRHEFGAIDDRVEPALQQADQVRARVAVQAERLRVVLVELALGNVAVIALELLLGLELGAEVGRLALAALTVLAGAVFALVDGALGRPQIFSPMRRSILYFASARFVIAVPLSEMD